MTQNVHRYRLTFAAAALLLLVGGCGDGPTPVTCDAAPIYSSGAIAYLTPTMLRTTLEDAANRSAPVVMGATASDFEGRLATARATLESSGASACRALKAARELLTGVASNPATDPDRATLQLALDLAESFVAIAP